MAWWTVAGKTCVAAYDAIGAASLADSYTDESGSGNDAAPGSAPAWGSGVGWTFSDSEYLTTGVTAADGYSAIVRFSGAVGGGSAGPVFGGTTTGTSRFSIYPYQATNKVFYGQGGSLEVAPNLAAGVLAIAGQKGYRDGSADAGTIGAWSGGGTAVFIGARNIGGGPSGKFTGVIQAFAMYSGTLSGAEVAALTTAINALPTSAGSVPIMMLQQHAAGWV